MEKGKPHVDLIRESTKPKHRFRFSTKTIFLLVTLLGLAFGLIALNSERILYGHLSGQYDSVFNVDMDTDLEQFLSRLNSQEILNDLIDQNPDHRRVLRKWSKRRHGFKETNCVKGTVSKSFELQIDFPIYCVRTRRFNWRNLWDDRFFTNGPDGKEARVGELNKDLYLCILQKVTEELARQSAQTGN